MTPKPDDICPRPDRPVDGVSRPLASPICPSSVYRCESPEEAAALLAGATPGFVYSRDGHPNAAQLADRCAELHGAERATVTGSGMAALALAMLSQLQSGDHVIASSSLYGRSLRLFTLEAVRLGVTTSVVDSCDVAAVAANITDETRLVVVETISNPLLRVADIPALAEVAHRRGARLLVDNSFASPTVCRPLELGADLVMESITKIINGHSDVMLGWLGGRSETWSRVADLQSTWGFFASPWDCWLASRGISTLHLRAERASANALRVAEVLSGRSDLAAVSYPGLRSHLDHALAQRQFGSQFGNVVTFTLPGGTEAARRLIAAAAETIPFCPSLGELCTTLSHPESTSHRTLAADARAAQGITGGMIRLSVGIESVEEIVKNLGGAIDAAGTR
ncbi:MAG: aminotransferase class I/II-fold pyridoxal phosphate-dependent enzyme [Planctomycetes bacterium]|nr:aminotransferase class I/II-fold pyridoxal phosphate-dependent enzyme [Planctomycetota bacterium]